MSLKIKNRIKKWAALDAALIANISGIVYRCACDREWTMEAIAIWEEWQPHLIWMDMRMPVMDAEAARNLLLSVKRQDNG